MDHTELIVKLYGEGKSLREIETVVNMYPSRIRRILKRAGVELRDKTTAAKMAVEQGKIKPPMQGKKMSAEKKAQISSSMANTWKNRTEAERESFKEGARKRWDDKTDTELSEMRRKSAQALRAASVEGSKLEKFLFEHLTKEGYHVKMHVTGLVVGEKYEVDLFLPERLIAIEIDGPHHFQDIYGNGDLRKTIEFDTIKNGALMQRGIRVIRVKYLARHNSLHINQTALNLIIDAIIKIEKNPEDRQNMLMELEISNG